MEEGDSLVCPICAESGFETLLDHLNAHSKQDLIGLLIQQRQQNVSPTPSRPPPPQQPSSSISLRSGRSLHNSGNGEAASTSRSKRTRGANVTRISPRNADNTVPLSIKPNVNRTAHGEDYELEFAGGLPRYNLVHSFSVPFPEEHASSRPQSRNSVTTVETCEINYNEEEDADSHPEVVLLQSFAENSEASVRQEDTRTAEHVQEESDNATSQTSIIKYIIDQVCQLIDG